MENNKRIVGKMRTLEEYLKRDLGYVSRWWKFGFIIWLFMQVVCWVLLYSVSYRPDDPLPDMDEIYFELGDKVIVIGIFNGN